MNYLLDSDICTALIKAKDVELTRKFRWQRPGIFFLCSIVKAELLFGSRNSARLESNLKGLDVFFSQFPSLPFDDRAAEQYGIIRATLAKLGTPIGANDLFIASIALAHDLVLLTRNAGEFYHVPALRVETW